MQYVYGALMLVLFIILCLLCALLIMFWNERRYPNIPKIVKSSHYVYGRLIWRLTPYKWLINPITDRKSFRILNWDEGIIETTKPLEVGDILIVQGKRGKQIAIMVIFFNSRDARWFEYETAFIGVHYHE